MKTTTTLLTLAIFVTSCGASSDPRERRTGPVDDGGTAVDASSNPDGGDDGGRDPCDACGPSDLCEPDTGRCVSEADIAVEMRDGVALDTRVILPGRTEGPFPVVLLRTPYGLVNGDYFRPFVTDDGYALVVQSCRGTGRSGGTLEPLAQELDDGRDAVRWIAAQPWSNGRIATIGASYEGFTALAAAVGNPEVVLALADGNISDAFTGWPGQRGIPVQASLLWWLNVVETGDDLMLDPAYWSAATNARPLIDLDKQFLGREHPTWRRLAPEADHDSAFWDARSLDGRLDEVCAPIVIFQAANEWADDPVEAFREAVTAPCSPEVGEQHRFVLAPGAHAGSVYDPFSGSFTGQLIHDALDAVLRQGAPELLSEIPVASYWVQGADEWRTADTWPPPHEERALYLAAGSEALADAPTGSTESSALAFDPETMDACDATGALAPPGATFTSEPLAEPLDLVGAPALEITVSTDLDDADVSAWLYEVRADGEMPWAVSQRLRLRFRDGYVEPQAMPSGEPVAVRLEWGTMARRIEAGSQIVIWVSTSECGVPENPGSLAPVMTVEEARAGTLTLWTGGERRSRLVLPIDRSAL